MCTVKEHILSCCVKVKKHFKEASWDTCILLYFYIFHLKKLIGWQVVWIGTFHLKLSWVELSSQGKKRLRMFLNKENTKDTKTLRSGKQTWAFLHKHEQTLK